MAVLLGCSALLTVAATARADQSESTIFDPGGILSPNLSTADRSRTIDRIARLGADTVRVVVPWRLIAPRPDSRRPPIGFHGSDPDDYPQHSFATLDQVLGEAGQEGLRVLLTPAGPAPDWASGSPLNNHVYPDPAEFGKFVEGLGNRYPQVSFWSVWNEPNLALFLRPQYVGGRSVSGITYRRLYLAARRGLRDSGHASDPVLIGETAPTRGKVSTPPIAFLRQVLCLDRRYRRSGHCRPIRAAGWAQHPYTPGVAPWQLPRSKGSISIGSLDRLTRALRLAAAAGATEGRLPVYVTEFGIESDPKPPKLFGLSQLRQAEYLGIAEYLLYRNPRVRSFAQYLMQDDGGDPAAHLTFDTGLRFADDKPKLSYSAFPITVVVRRRRAGEVEIWGHVRPGRGPRLVEVAYKDADGASGALAPVLTDQNGYFDFSSEYRPGRRWRATTAQTNGELLSGPLIRSYRF